MIFNLFRSTDKQEETSTQYQSWRDANPDNPSDDDFYEDDYESDADDDTGDEPENVKPWLGWFGL
jgi:hypothetical protein